MGLPERLVDRQLAKAQGVEADRIQAVRTGQNVLLASVVLGLLTASLNLFIGTYLLLWGPLGLLWLGVGYVNLRQRRYLKSRRV